MEAIHVSAHLAARVPESCTTFTLNSHGGRAATGKKSLASMLTGSLQSCQTLHPCSLWSARLLCQGEGFSRQEYWSILANTGCHTLLEHCISCCPSRQPPENLVLPEPLRPKQLHHLHTWPSQGKPKSSRAASGANPSGRPTCRGGNKP